MKKLKCKKKHKVKLFIMERLVNLVTSLNFSWIKYYTKFPFGWSVYRSETPQRSCINS